MNNSRGRHNGAGRSSGNGASAQQSTSLRARSSGVANGPHDSRLARPAEEGASPADETHGVSKPTRANPPLFVDIPKSAAPADIALAALQYLPTPIVVLSSSKRVILANESMGRLLGLEKSGALQKMFEDGEVQNISVTEVLWGQSLSQIGVDMLQDGEPVWVDWDVRLQSDCRGDVEMLMIVEMP